MGFKDSITDFLKINELRENIIKLIEAKFELTKIEIQEKVEGLVSQLIHSILTLFFAFMLVIFLCILIAVGINKWLESNYWGFVIVTALFLILFLMWFLNNKFFQKQIQQTIEKIIDEKMNEKSNQTKL